MNHLSLFENFRRPIASAWPRRKKYTSVRVLDVLDLKDPKDYQRIKSYMQEAKSKLGWFQKGFDESGEISNYVRNSDDLFFIEIINPKGQREIIAFDNFDNTHSEQKSEGLLSGEDLLGRYNYWIQALNFDGDIELELDSLDFEQRT